MSSKKRLSLDLHPDMHDLMTKLADEDHTSRADVIRKAIGFYKMAKEMEKNGKRIAVTDGNNNIEYCLKFVGL